MANEHVLMTQKTIPISMTCADGTGIEKGTLLKMTDPNTAAASAAANDIIVGVAYTEKVASDGNTQCSVLTGPGDELRAFASGSVSVGDALVSAVPAGNNLLASASGLTPTDLSGSTIVGYSKETATVGQSFKYVLNITKYSGIAA